MKRSKTKSPSLAGSGEWWWNRITRLRQSIYCNKELFSERDLEIMNRAYAKAPAAVELYVYTVPLANNDIIDINARNELQIAADHFLAALVFIGGPGSTTLHSKSRGGRGE